jgi:hypothetical protein
MQSRLAAALTAACLATTACTPQANLEHSRDQRTMDAYAASKTEKPSRDWGLRWPNGNGVSQDRKLVKIEKIDARTSAFGKREIKVRLTTEVSGWKTVDGKRQPDPTVRQETEERWIPAE